MRTTSPDELAQRLDPDDLVRLADDVEDQDPEVALTALGALHQWREEWLTEMEELAIMRARAEGYPWSRIADHLGRSRQAVWEKYRDPDETASD